MCLTRRRRTAAFGPKAKSSPFPSISAVVVSTNLNPGAATVVADGSSPVDESSSDGTAGLSSTTSSSSSAAILSFVRSSLRDNTRGHSYSFAELLSATDKFLSRPLSSSSSSWRCTLRGADVAVIRRTFNSDPATFSARLAALCRSHHGRVAKLRGACLSNDSVYIVYDFVNGASLAQCLRNPRNPSFCPLSSWLSRVQVATDLAQGLEYVHHYSCQGRGTVHSRIKSSSFIILENSLRAKICHFGATELAGKLELEESHTSRILSQAKMSRSDSGGKKFEGARGYMAPEVIASQRVSRRSDVFAFGVVLLELISGEEPVRYRFDKETGNIVKVSVIDTARAAFGQGEDEEVELAAMAERRGRVRQWVDGRLRDSYPVEAAELLIRVALRCVEEEEGLRPELVWVAGKLSQLLVEAKEWDEKVRRNPTEISVSLAPR